MQIAPRHACCLFACLTTLLLTWPGGLRAQTHQLFPRDFARQEKEETVVGEGGRLVLVEDENGDELEVVTWTPSRNDQRQKDIPLFSTVLDPKRKIETLPKPYPGWDKGQAVTKQYAEPVQRDRTIYRRDSAAWHARVHGSYEGVVLAETLARLAWLWQEAVRDKLVEPQDAPEWLVRQPGYLPAWQAWEGRRSQHQYLSLLLAQTARLPALAAERRAHLAEHTRLTPLIAAKTAAIAEAETALAGKSPPPGDASYRKRAILLMEELDLKADQRWAEREAERCQMELSRTLEALLAEQGEGATVPPLAEVLAAAETDLPATLAKLTPPLTARLQALTTALAANPTLATFVQAGADACWTRLQTASQAEGPKPTALVAKLKAAFATQPAPAAVAAALTALGKAADKLPTMDYGRYQVTLRSKLEGIPHCLGTGIQVSFGGLTHTLYPYHWADTERFHDIKLDFELREPPHHLLEFTKPSGQAALFAWSRNLDHYNQTRLKGWQFADESALGRRLKLVFGTEHKNIPRQVHDGLRSTERSHLGTLELSLKTLQTQRRNGRGLGAPDASLDALTLESLSVRRVEEAPLVLRQTLVQRNWQRPGEANAAMAWLHNRGSQDRQATLKATLISGLDERRELGERAITVPAGSFARFVMPFTPPANTPLWGQELRLTLVTPEGQQEAGDVFTIHPNTFAVFLSGGHTGRHVYHDFKDYKNHNENFGVTIGDSIAVLPDDLRAPYVRGMTSGSLGHIEHTRAEVQRNHQLGVGTVMYLSPLCTGDRSYYHYLRHPEWFPERLKWTEGMNDNWQWNQKAVAEAWYAGKGMEFFLKEYPILHLEQPVNHGQQLLFDRLVEDLITYHYMVGWDGVRWDGGPMNVFTHDFLGRPLMHPKTGQPVNNRAATNALAAERMAELKQRLWQHFPHWVYGNNGDTEGYGPQLLNLDRPPPDQGPYPHYREFMKDGGSYMDEGWMSADAFADSRNRVEDYLKIGFKQAQVMKAAGGYLQTFSPERDGAGHFEVDHIYYTLLPHLFGASYYGKLSASPWSVDGPVHFQTRFVGYLMDPALRTFPESARRIKFDAPGVWFHEAATIRKLSERHTQVIIPIINQHPRERLYETHYRYNDLPRPLTGGLPMSVEAPADLAGLTPTVWELSCEPTTRVTKLDATRAGAVTNFTVPGLKLFKLIVLDYQGGQP